SLNCIVKSDNVEFVDGTGWRMPETREMCSISWLKAAVHKFKGDAGMKRERQMKVARGSGNVFRDLGYANADAEQLKVILAAETIKLLDREGLTVRAAYARTGIAATDFSRI